MLRSVARLVFTPPIGTRREFTPPAVVDAAPADPLVDLFAYADDCILSGRIALTGARLTDLLNNHDEFTLVDVLVESLADHHVVATGEVAIRRDELVLVEIVGPRGDPERRHRTRQHPLAVQAGPYHVRGYLHALPGSDPIASLRHRRPMVPLTDALVEHVVDGVPQRRQLSAVLVNRDRIDSVVEVDDSDIRVPDMPIAHDKGPLLKDFTGAVHGEADPDDDDRL